MTWRGRGVYPGDEPQLSVQQDTVRIELSGTSRNHRVAKTEMRLTPYEARRLADALQHYANEAETAGQDRTHPW